MSFFKSISKFSAEPLDAYDKIDAYYIKKRVSNVSNVQIFMKIFQPFKNTK